MKRIKLEKEFVKRFEDLFKMSEQISDLSSELKFQRTSLWRDVEKKHGKENFEFDSKNQELIIKTDEELEKEDPLQQLKNLFTGKK